MNWLRPLALLALSGTSMLAGILGTEALDDGARHEQTRRAVEQSRRQLSGERDESAIQRHVAEIITPSVVNLSVRKRIVMSRSDLPLDDATLQRLLEAHGGEDGAIVFEQTGTGSGVIMDAADGVGYILSNSHVIGPADRVDVTLHDGRVIRNAGIVGIDARTDLAVVRIKAERLIPAKWGDSETLRMGDRVMAFGSPFGLSGSMTHGIVSALNRRVGILGQFGYEDFIQTDAAINPGNSGGPLVDRGGAVVGITTAIASEDGGFQGIGFAVPSSVARHVYASLKDKGKITRGWVGITSEDVARARAEARAAGHDGQDGVLVRSVLRGAPAMDKLRPGDVIVMMDRQPVKDVRQLRQAIAATAPGATVTMGVVRSGQRQDVRLTVGEQPGAAPGQLTKAAPVRQPAGSGLRFMDVPESLATAYGLGNSRGALILGVTVGSPAADAGLRRGDVVTQIGQDDVHSAEEAKAALARADLRKGVRIFVSNRRGQEARFLQNHN